ncbi:probable serine/threonine-protein kinase At1g54610 [Solanum verrucosum]|uniref:probable serine/threonine-protein kinase At1g54610 n=1 Tax=Solanum verrucosum TaxID=315347 RepID=UPI0020D12600|nr:probable serine/threonine-protein kinase At1g54610 [Solanum verrucosum]
MSIYYVKSNDSIAIGSTHEKQNVPRISRSIPNAMAGEQIAAGWPAWLVATGTEAIHGWLPRKLESFHMLDKIGYGAYSTVYKARDLEHNKIVALKRLKFDNVELMMKEINILRRLDHENVIKLEGLIITSGIIFGLLYLILEYMEHDLKGLLSIPGAFFSESQIKCYMKQLLNGINHVHSRGILHRDITTSNLLLDNRGILKIADFGLSTLSKSKPNVPLTSCIGTLWYRAPELLIGSCFYGIEVDLWSIGCVLGELFNGKGILQGNNEIDQLHKIFKLCGSPSDEYWRKYNSSNAAILKQKVPYNAKIEETFHDFPVAALELMQILLSIEPQSRGTAAIAMDHSFFKVEPFATDSFSLPKYPPTKGLDVKWKNSKVCSTIFDEMDHSFFKVEPFATDSFSLPEYPPTKGLDVKWKNSKVCSTIFDEINWMDERHDLTNDALGVTPWVTIDERRRYKMPESANSSEGANRDKGKEDQEHNFWSFIKGKKKQNHVPSTAASKRVNGHDIKGKKQQYGLLTTASNQNDRDFKGKKSDFYARLPVESNPMDVDRVLREHDRHIQEVVERAKLEKKMRAKVQVEGRNGSLVDKASHGSN